MFTKRISVNMTMAPHCSMKLQNFGTQCGNMEVLLCVSYHSTVRVERTNSLLHRSSQKPSLSGQTYGHQSGQASWHTLPRQSKSINLHTAEGLGEIGWLTKHSVRTRSFPNNSTQTLDAILTFKWKFKGRGKEVGLSFSHTQNAR